MSKAIKKAELKLIKAKTTLTNALIIAAGIGVLSSLIGLVKLLIDLLAG